MFSMTRSAAEQILAAAERSSASGMPLRVAARREADGSIGYGLGFDEQREEDQPLDFAGVMVLIGPPSQALLADTVLDFVEMAPGEFGFVFGPADALPPEEPGGACGSGGCSRCGG